MNQVVLVFSVFFLLRLVSLFISIKNEKKIIQYGGIQYGKFNSILLTLIHIIFYFSCLYEAFYNGNVYLDRISYIGIIFLCFAYFILFYVIYELGNIWTLKIYILKDHKINNSFLFRYVRHPNYFLNIIPELLGMVLLCRAYKTFLILMPIYLIILGIRIYQEEKAMKDLFKK